MFLYFSKLLPMFIYPLGLATLLLVLLLLLRRRPRWVMALGLAALLLIWVGGNRLVSMTIIRSLEWRHAPLAAGSSAEVVVVLGGSTRPQTAPRPLHEINEAGDRLLYAAELYRQGVAPQLLVSGGIVGVNGPAVVSEAESMTALLELMGVPRAAVWQEDRSRNTYENAVEIKQLLDRKAIDRIILVTSAMHMPRSVAIFQRQGFEVIPAPTDFLVTQADWDYYFAPDPAIQVFNLLPGAEAMDRTVMAVKEYIGMVVYRLRGWL